MTLPPSPRGEARDGAGSLAAPHTPGCAQPAWFEVGEAVWLGLQRERLLHAAGADAVAAQDTGADEDAGGAAAGLPREPERPEGAAQPQDERGRTGLQDPRDTRYREGPQDPEAPSGSGTSGSETPGSETPGGTFQSGQSGPEAPGKGPETDPSFPPSPAPAPGAPARPAPVPGHDTGPVPSGIVLDLGTGVLIERSRALERALEPLRRRVPAKGVPEVLLEEETAVRAAETGVWLPYTAPARERWLTLDLFVDAGDASMELWHATAARFAETLACSGAFRDIRRHRWTPGRAAHGPVFRPEDDGRHAVLVLTDLHAAHWADGCAQRELARWSRTASVALVHVLPEHLWTRCRINPGRSRLTGPRPAAANVRWSAEPDGLGALSAAAGRAAGGAVVPVLSLTPEGLGGWARFVAGQQPGPYLVRTVDVPGVRRVPPAGTGESVGRRIVRLPGYGPGYGPGSVSDGPGQGARDPRHVARSLRAQLSPTAYRLARLCAAVPLNLSVLHLVRRTLLPEARLWHLAELLLTGVLQHSTVTTWPPELPVGARIELDFAEGVREELLAEGTRRDTARVLAVTFDHLADVASRGPAGGFFRQIRELVSDPGRAIALPEDTLQPWLIPAIAGFRALSGPYATTVARISAAVAAAETPSRDSPAASAGPDRDPPVGGPPQDRDPEPPGTGEDAPASEAPGDDSGTTSGEPGSPHEERTTEVTGPQPAPAGPRKDGLHKPPPVWGNVPPRNRAFTGRGPLLEDLHRRLQQGTTAVLPEALQGMGGVGKSQLAVEYVYRHQHEYQVIWWIPSEQPQQIRQFLVALARKLNLDIGGGEANTALPAVIEALRIGEPYKNWLLVFDNAENPDAVREFFPTNGPGRILVTSRNTQWASSARPLEVDVFTREESVALLQLRAPSLDDGTADQLAEILGDLPLAVEQAAVWLSETGMPGEEYLRLFDEQFNELMVGDPAEDDLSTHRGRSVAAAWNVSLGRLRRKHPAALQLLQVCAFFAPEPISRRLLTGVRDAPVPPELNAALSNPIRLSRAIREISRYALARIDHETNTIQLHRLVQRVLINQMPDTLQKQMREGAHRLLAHGDPGAPEASGEWQQYGELLPHVLHSQAVRSSDPWVRQLVLNEVRYQIAWGDFQGARDLAQLADDTWRETQEQASQDVLDANQLLAVTQRALGRYNAAYALDEHVLRSARETLGEEHEFTLAQTAQVAWDLRLRGAFEQAFDLDRRVYETNLRLFGPNDIATLDAAHRHALNLRFVGNLAQALELDEDTYRRKAAEFGENSLSTLHTAASVQRDLMEAGEYLGSRDLARDIADRYIYTVGENHPNTLGALRNLAMAERRAGNREGALELSGKVVEAYRARYGSQYPASATTLMVHSIDVRYSGDVERALELGEQGAKAYESLFGPEHPHALAARINNAVTLRLLGRAEEGKALNESVRHALGSILGSGHPHTLAAATDLAADLYALGETQAAADLATATMESGRQSLGDNHPLTLAVASNLTLVLRLLGRADEADELHRDTVERYVNVLGADHPSTVAAREGEIINCDIDLMVI